MRNARVFSVLVIMLVGCVALARCSQAPMTVVPVVAADAKQATRDSIKEPVAMLWQSFVKAADAEIAIFEKQYKSAAEKASIQCGEQPVFVYLETKDAEVSVDPGTGPFVHYDEKIFTIDTVAAVSIDEYSGIKRVSLFRGVLGEQFSDVKKDVFALAMFLSSYSERVGKVGDDDLNKAFIALCRNIETRFNETESSMVKYLEASGFCVLDASYKRDAIDVWRSALEKEALLSREGEAVKWLDGNSFALAMWFFFDASEAAVKAAFTRELERLATAFRSTFVA